MEETWGEVEGKKKEHIHTHNLMETSSNAKFLKNHTLSTPNPPLPQQSQFIQTARYYFKSEGYVARPFGFSMTYQGSKKRLFVAPDVCL